MMPHINSKELVDVHDMKIPSSEKYLGFNVPNDNFDFGAEIFNNKKEILSSTDAMGSLATTTATPATSEKQTKTKTLNPTTEEQEENGAKPNTTELERNCEKNQLLEKSISDDDDDDEEDEDGDDDEDDTNCDDDDDEEESSSQCSSIGTDWKLRWLQREFYTGRVPRQVIASMMPHLTAEPDDSVLWDYLAHILSEPRRRTKLSNVNTFDDVVDLVNKSERIIVLTGAGVSVSCGIPDFRSTNGIYARLAHDFPDLPDPQAMFDINYFKRDPRPFYKFAREIYPGEFQPSPCHRFIKLLETKGKLLRNYTQNIDTLEQVAGIQSVIECHGSFSSASCTKCKFKCNADALRADIFAQRIPVCPKCQPNVEQSVDASVAVTEDELKQLVENGIMKPDIVFFGEGLPDEYHNVMATDKDKCDLLVVIGSSLKVRPVAHIPSSIPASVPQILINREQLHHLKFDVELLGDSDVIINQICHRLGKDWQQALDCPEELLIETKELLPAEHHQSHHYRLSTSESSEQQSQLDTDTQSVKSNSSLDYMLGSAGTCSDSGFESSTFTATTTTSTTQQTTVASISCDRLAAPITKSLTETYRHLSVDSSKDSGIEPCDISSPIGSSSVDTANTMKVAAPSLTPTPLERKRQSAAERLPTGTFYCHGRSCSYVFPGAQVFWDNEYSDDDEEDDDNDDRHVETAVNCTNGDNENNDNDEHSCDFAPLSPLLPPSVEAHIVTDIANVGLTTADTCSPNKRRSSSTVEQEGSSPPALDSPPPIKKLRPSIEAATETTTQTTAAVAAASTALTTTVKCMRPKIPQTP